MNTLRARWLGSVPYREGEVLQRAIHERACDDYLLLQEHPHVYTMGSSARPEHVLREPSSVGAELVSADRGGDVTYHGPGQLVGYPILKLNRYCEGPKAYVRMLEEVIIRTLRQWNIVGRRLEKSPGVWVGDGQPSKIAAIGTRIERGVTMHGFALNVMMDLAPFSLIVPCGIPACPVTSMAEVLTHPVDLTEVHRCVAEQFSGVFGLEWMEP
ncbi:MAG TPA: lipoyl(octanoyl) transferase LipB [Acidimicrobiia bacterium]|nr:lipoyl(octanoyl) transferase LipB [Acidimicrobiia bacterium]